MVIDCVPILDLTGETAESVTQVHAQKLNKQIRPLVWRTGINKRQGFVQSRAIG